MICPQCEKQVGAIWEPSGLCLSCQFPPNPNLCRGCGHPSEKHCCPSCYHSQQDRLWRQMVPPLFYLTEVARLPQQKLQQVMEWQYGSQGLMLTGLPGTCKTRCAFELLKRLHWEGLAIQITSGFEFGAECGRGLMDGSWYERLDTLMNVSILFIDDLDKCKMSETVETQLFGLIDYRTSHLKPLIVTLNSGKDQLEQRFSEVRGGPIIRRLSEFATVVKF